MTDLRIDGHNNVPQMQPQQASTAGGGASEPVIVNKPVSQTSDEGLEASGLKITREDVKEAQGELGIRTSAKTKERVAQMHNDYAQRIFSVCTDGAPPQLKAIALQYISELPKASRGNDIQDYKNLCEVKLEGFRSAVRDLGMAEYLQQMEENAQARFKTGEATADARANELVETVKQTGADAVAQINANTDEKVAQAVIDIKRHTTATSNKAIRRINANTNRGLNAAVKNINAHTTAEADRGINANLQNMRALHGVDENNNQVDDNESLITTDGVLVYGKDTTLGRIDRARDAVKSHITNQADRVIDEVNSNNRENAALTAKRQTMTDMLNEEIKGGGIYRDSTVTWLGNAADRIIANPKLKQEQKEAALDELTRMINEEFVISDGDKAEFEEKYSLKNKNNPKKS